MLCAHIVLSQGGYGALADGIGRNRRHELCVMAVISQGYGHIGLAAAVVDVKLVGLNKFLVVWCGQSQHNLAHGYNLCHSLISFMMRFLYDFLYRFGFLYRLHYFLAAATASTNSLALAVTAAKSPVLAPLVRLEPVPTA